MNVLTSGAWPNRDTAHRVSLTTEPLDQPRLSLEQLDFALHRVCRKGMQGWQLELEQEGTGETRTAGSVQPLPAGRAWQPCQGSQQFD